MNELLTGKEVAVLLRVSLSTVLKLRSEGKLPFVQIGRKVLYKKSAIDAFMNDNETRN